MGDVVRLHLPRRRRRIAATPLFPVEIQPFPLIRYAGAVDEFSRELRALPSLSMRSAAMVERIELEWDRLCSLGTDEAALERALLEFARAVWAEVDRIECGGVA